MKKNLRNYREKIMKEKTDCSTCFYYDVVFGNAVCSLWKVGFSMRGLEPCDEYKERKEKNYDKRN